MDKPNKTTETKPKVDIKRLQEAKKTKEKAINDKKIVTKWNN